MRDFLTGTPISSLFSVTGFNLVSIHPYLSLNNDTLSHLIETVETAMTAPFHRSSLIHFVCIWVAPPRLSTPQPREQSRVHNSNAGKIDQSWSNPFMNNVLSFILYMPVCWFVAFIVNLIVVAQVTIPNLKTTLQAILPGCFFLRLWADIALL